MEFLSHIIELIKEFYYQLVPCYIVEEYNHAIILRLGKFHRILEPGFYWKVPFIDTLLETRSTVTTLNVRPQTLTTKDGNNIIISAVIKYQVVDPKIFLLGTENAVDAIGDLTQGRIKDFIIHRTWDECKKIKDSELKKKVELEAKEWGIKIYSATITDLAITRSIRLIQNQ